VFGDPVQAGGFIPIQVHQQIRQVIDTEQDRRQPRDVLCAFAPALLYFVAQIEQQGRDLRIAAGQDIAAVTGKRQVLILLRVAHRQVRDHLLGGIQLIYRCQQAAHQVCLSALGIAHHHQGTGSGVG